MAEKLRQNMINGSKAADLRNRRHGNTLIEMMLLMPLLMALCFGAMEYGYAMYIKHTLQGAAREGARAAVVAGATATDVQNAVDGAMLAAGFGQTKYTRPPTMNPANWATQPMGTTVTVTVQATWGTIGFSALPTWLKGIPTDKVVRGATAMRKEG